MLIAYHKNDIYVDNFCLCYKYHNDNMNKFESDLFDASFAPIYSQRKMLEDVISVKDKS